MPQQNVDNEVCSADDNWGVKEYLQNNKFKYVQDYLLRIDHLLTMSDSVQQITLPTSYESVSTSDELLKKTEKPIILENQSNSEIPKELSDNPGNSDCITKTNKPSPLINNFVTTPTNNLDTGLLEKRLVDFHLQSEINECERSQSMISEQNEPNQRWFSENETEFSDLETENETQNFKLPNKAHEHRLDASIQLMIDATVQRVKTKHLEEIPISQPRSSKLIKARNQSKQFRPEKDNSKTKFWKTMESNSKEYASIKISKNDQEFTLHDGFVAKNVADCKIMTSPPSSTLKQHTKQNVNEKNSTPVSNAVSGQLHNSSSFFVCSNETFDSNFSLDQKPKPQDKEEMEQVVVPKLNLNGIEEDNVLSDVVLELKDEVGKLPTTEPFSNFENRPATQKASCQSIKNIRRNKAIRLDGESTAELHAKRPATADQSRKVSSSNVQRKWKKSSIAWSSYGKNQLRTWSSIQLPKKRLPRSEKLQKSKPIAAALSTCSLPKFCNSLLCFPEEVLLHIFSFLSVPDIFNVSKVCRVFDRISHDYHLWKHVKVTDVKVNDEWLAFMGNRSPQSVSMTECNGRAVTNVGLRTFFRSCKTSLTDLHLENCTGDQLSGDSVLLHASCHCRNLTRINVAWSRTTENGVIAIAVAFPKIAALNISGNSAVGEEAFEALIKKHAKHLKSLEMSGCFGASSDVVLRLVKATTSLQTLNIGLCGKIPTQCVIEMCPSLTNLKHFDLRGIKSVTNQCLHTIATRCKRLKTLIISNCSQVTDVGIAEIATYRNTLTHLDISGCSLVSDQGIVSFLMVAKSIEYLDLSGSGATHVCVQFIVEHNHATIKTLKLSFCHNITLKCLLDLLNVAVSLQSLHLYGCKRIKLSQLMKANIGVVIEK